MLFVQYPKCTTCIKAKKYLDGKEISYTSRHIAEDRPTREELSAWIEKSGEDIKKFFNTSGKLYKELNLKDKLKDMSYDEKLDLLSSDGLLVKRPILVTDDIVLVGFKEEKWEEVVK
ncbi:MAG: Spx/MgsR family RNA polymerase-binding regulatory protein [Eubacteriaceae bacterium]|nr:Spx/MgsR family RNA polymerase-binding regulatory protein [Eubacteriaceae bacterium]